MKVSRRLLLVAVWGVAGGLSGLYFQDALWAHQLQILQVLGITVMVSGVVAPARDTDRQTTKRNIVWMALGEHTSFLLMAGVASRGNWLDMVAVLVTYWILLVSYGSASANLINLRVFQLSPVKRYVYFLATIALVGILSRTGQNMSWSWPLPGALKVVVGGLMSLVFGLCNSLLLPKALR